jgi:hypothetical protein
MMWQHRWALLSGFLGATASCLVKLAITTDRSSPLMYLSDEYCQPNLTEDLDVILLRKIHWALGTLMVRYRINLTHLFRVTQAVFQDWISELGIFEVDWCHFGLVVPRIACLIVMILLNAFMIAAFLKGLNVSGSVVGTALSSASNFSASALYGGLLWKERFATTWWIGFGCVMTGVLVLSSVQAVAEEKKEDSSYRRSGGKTKKSFPGAVSTNERPTIRPSFQPTPKKSAAALRQYRGSVTSTATTRKAPAASLFAKKKELTTALIDRTFANECPLCEGQLFDESTGSSISAIADLSPHCFHVIHAKCLKQQQSSPKVNGKSKCPVCDKSISMWISAKQAAHFAGFWMDRVESALQELGPLVDQQGSPQPRPAEAVRALLRKDDSLSGVQKQYIDDDPTGLGKGLASGLEWGGYVDYNDCAKGHVGWSLCLRTRGIWKYDVKQDELWLWEWDLAHPRQRCEQCQFLKRPLPVTCPGCVGSSEAAFYCSEPCQKRDWQRHKMTCNRWQQHGPEQKKR